MEQTPVLQVRINTLTKDLATKTKVLEETRELLKRAEEENLKLKATLEGVVNAKKETFFRKVMGDIVEVVDNIKFQSPIVRKES